MEREKLRYHTYEELIAELNLIQKKYSAIVRMETIGLSREGRALPALKISDTPQEEDKDPAVLFVSLIHGNEVIGLEVLLGLIKKLVSDYGREEEITNLVRDREIWFLPVVNPDGFVRRSRKNFNEVDLDRNFRIGFNSRGWLSKWRKWIFYSGEYPFSELETKAVKNFLQSHKFTISCSFHSFLGMINFPYGYTRKKARDYELLRAIGEEMSKRQPYQHYWVKQMSWLYKIQGSFVDEVYENHHTFSFLIEISRGGFNILKPPTWLNPFSWFNPENIQYQIENNLAPSLYLLEISDNPEKVLR